MKRIVFISCFVLTVVATAIADREPPKDVPPIRQDEITYKAPHFGGHMGCIEAHDTQTDQLVWRRQIYVVKYQPDLEEDVQDCFIASMEIKGGKLIIKNEMQFEYELDLASLAVKVAKGALVICRGKEADNGTLRQHNLNELDSFFGPLPKAEQLITGVDLKGFIQTLLGDQAKLPLCSPLRRSVGYRYKLSLASDSRTTPLFIDIGVYDSADTANSVLVDEWGAVSAPGHPASGFGDRAVASPTCVRTIVNNVFVCVSLSPANEELFKTIVDELVQELRSGTTRVARGKTVPVPRIASLNLPDRMAGDETLGTVVVIENTDTSKLLLGVSGDERVSVNRVGSEIRLNVKANRKPGQLKAVLCVATPDNVVATAEISVAVQ